MAARIAMSQAAGGSAFTNSVVTVTPRRAETSLHAACSASITRSRRAPSVSRMSVSSLTLEGMLLTAPGNTSQTPTVATVSIAPEDFCRRLKCEDQLRGRGQRIFAARHQPAPACPPSPSMVMRRLAGAAICVTSPRSIPSCSSSGPARCATRQTGESGLEAMRWIRARP